MQHLDTCNVRKSIHCADIDTKKASQHKSKLTYTVYLRLLKLYLSVTTDVRQKFIVRNKRWAAQHKVY